MITTKASGRVCLFGDHQDYLGLPVIACAINRSIRLEALPNTAHQLNIDFLDIGETRSITVPHNFKNYDPEDPFIAVLSVLKRFNCCPNKGYDIKITGDIPINAGLSSSSALVLVWVAFLLKAFGKSDSYQQEFIARIAYEAEVLERNSPGGKMDQYSISLGHIIYLETSEITVYKTFERTLPGLIIGESGIAKDTLGLLADRRSLAIEAIDFLKKKHGNFDISTINEYSLDLFITELPKHLQPFFNAAVRNHLITQRALSEFEQDKLRLKTIGTLMSSHHDILKNDLKITVPRIDNMIDAALQNGAYGAKIVGSGGGGCIVALAPKEKEQQIITALKSAGAVDAYAVKVSEGIVL